MNVILMAMESFYNTPLMIIILLQFTGPCDKVRLYCTDCKSVLKRQQCICVNYQPHLCKLCNTRIKFCCRICDRMYTTYFSCFRHQKITHDGVRQQCPKCPYKTKYKGMLDRHIQRHEPSGHKVRHKQCLNCGKAFRQLAAHMKKKACAPKKSDAVFYDCPHCGKNFVHSISRDRHIRNMQCRMEYQCEHCEELFDEKVFIAVHMRTHMNTSH